MDLVSSSFGSSQAQGTELSKPTDMGITVPNSRRQGCFLYGLCSGGGGGEETEAHTPLASFLLPPGLGAKFTKDDWASSFSKLLKPQNSFNQGILLGILIYAYYLPKASVRRDNRALRAL